MMGEKKPALRFKGFVGEWDTCRLKDIALFNPKADIPEQFEYVDLESVVGTEMVSHRTETRNTAPSRAQRLANIGDLFYQTVRPYQKNNCLFEKRDGCYVFSTGYAQMRPYTDSYFLLSLLQNNLFLKSVLNQCTGTSYPAINSIVLAEIEVSFSIYNENRKIGVFFKHLDTLITQQQRKYDSLLNVKKSMLEKMFPKDGADVPEIRFKGFSEAWGQRTLGSIADKVTEKNLNQKYTETFTNSAEYGVVTQLDYFDHTISNVKNIRGYYVVRNDDFIYNPRVSSEAPVGPFNRNKLQRTGIMSPLYSVFRIHDIDHTFLEQYFKSSYWHSFMRLNGDNGARADRFSIKGDKFIEMPIPYPCLDEQNMIAEYLSEIDFLISLHHQKLDHLKHIKSALLEKMFVSEAA